MIVISFNSLFKVQKVWLDQIEPRMILSLASKTGRFQQYDAGESLRLEHLLFTFEIVDSMATGKVFAVSSIIFLVF